MTTPRPRTDAVRRAQAAYSERHRLHAAIGRQLLHNGYVDGVNLGTTPTPPRREPDVTLKVPPAFAELYQPARYKIFWGGRGSGKSWQFARALVAKAHTEKKLILCSREYQTSIRDSVHRVIARQIDLLSLRKWFNITDRSILSRVTGSEFIFKGLHHNAAEIQSTEGVDICWVSEARAVAEESWRALIPTIREPGSEIWVDFNPWEKEDPTYKRFVTNPPPEAIVRRVSYRDNPYFPEELEKERAYDLQIDQDAYDWVWEGECRRISAAAIFNKRFEVCAFETPESIDRFYYGVDWGFSRDPTCLIRCFIKDDCLYIDYEAYGIGVELDDLEFLFDGGIAKKNGVQFAGVPGVRDWPIKADSARPETISYVRRQGFNIEPADKWKGSVEDGIAHLKGFKRIYIHERCPHVAQEFRLYSYKVDKLSGDVLPTIEDKFNHGPDACRYALDGYIQQRGGLGVWAKLAGPRRG